MAMTTWLGDQSRLILCTDTIVSGEIILDDGLAYDCIADSSVPVHVDTTLSY